MTTLRPVALLVLGACATASFAAETSVEEDVLTLSDAARLLRVPSKVVVKLAQSGSVPTRRVGKEWRFNRVALMEWLQGERYAYPAVPAKAAGKTNLAAQSATPAPATELPAAAKVDTALVPGELAALTGRGIGPGEPQRLAQATLPTPPTSPAPATAPAAPAAPPAAGAVAQQPIGEAPSGLTAEEVALRDQGVLLKAGQANLELGLSYARQTRENFPFLRVEQDTTTANFTGRYGIRNDLQVTGSMPVIYRHSATFANEVAFGSGVSGSDGESYAGDLSLSLQGVALHENVGRPNLVWSVDAVVPTGPGDQGLGTGLILSKSYDPVVIYGGINYLYGFDTDRSDPQRTLAKNNWSFNLGYAYAVNDSIALSGALAGFYRTPAQPTDPIPPERESYLLQLGLTWQLGRGLFVEPAVALGLGGAAPDFTFSLKLPYTF
jgi:excisionase family DNA binding protein